MSHTIECNGCQKSTIFPHSMCPIVVHAGEQIVVRLDYCADCLDRAGWMATPVVVDYGKIATDVEYLIGRRTRPKPPAPEPGAKPAETATRPIKYEFDWLADRWLAETRHLSYEDTGHPANRLIRRLGDPCVPLIIERLRKSPGIWFHTLSLLTHGLGPSIPADEEGLIGKMVERWVRWWDGGGGVNPQPGGDE